MSQTPLVVGVFNDEARAKTAIDALRAAGFGYDQVGVASQATGNTTTNLRGDLTNLGLADDQAGYYDNEFRQGRTVVSVRPDGRDDDAMNILRSNGAYDYNNQEQTTGNAGNYAQSGMPNTANTYADNTANAGYTQSGATNPYTDNTANTNYAQSGNANTYTDNTANAANTDYAQTGMANPSNYSATNAPNTGYNQGADYANETEDQRALRLREEQLNVNKERTQSGEVRLGKNVVEEQKTVNVPVTHEEVYVERRPVTGGQVDDTPISQDETIRVPVSEEQVNVTKTPVVTGEVAVGKRAVQENQQVSDTVRREEARVDQSGNPIVQGADDMRNTENNTFNRDNTDTNS